MIPFSLHWGSTTVAPSAPGQRRPLERCRWYSFHGLFHRGFPAKVEPIVESDPNEKEETPVIQWWMPMGCSIGWLWLLVDRIWTFSDIFFVDWVMGDTVSTIRSYYIYIYSWVISSYSLKLMHERKVPGVWRLRYQTLGRTWSFNFLQDALRRVADALQLNQHGTHAELHNSLNSAQTFCPNQ